MVAGEPSTSERGPTHASSVSVGLLSLSPSLWLPHHSYRLNWLEMPVSVAPLWPCDNQAQAFNSLSAQTAGIGLQRPGDPGRSVSCACSEKRCTCQTSNTCLIVGFSAIASSHCIMEHSYMRCARFNALIVKKRNREVEILVWEKMK